MTITRYIPWLLVLIGIWLLIRDTPLSWSVAPIALATIMVEFYKSGDIGLRRFQFDLALAVLTLTAMTAILTHFATTGSFLPMPDLVVAAVVLADAWVSPVNSFRTALRNLQGNVYSEPQV